MPRKAENGNKVTDTSAEEKNSIEKLLEEANTEIVFGDEESEAEEKELESNVNESEAEEKELESNVNESEPKEKEHNLKSVILKKAGSFYGKGQLYKKNKVVEVTQEKFEYLMSTGLFEEVR